MQVELPFYESPEDAVRAAVQALGGAKKVGAALWPDLLADNAARKMLDALNTTRPEKLDISQVIRVFGWAKEAGHHEPFAWYASQVGYDVKPVAHAEEVDRLTTVIEQSTRQLAFALSTLERLQRGSLKAVA